MVALDAAGRVIRPALLWNDTRSAAAAAALTDEVGAADFARRTGSVPVASFTLAKLRWLRDNEPDNAKRVAAVALPHDWLTWRLLGYGPDGESPLGPDLDALVTDRSDASGTAYFSPATDEYDLDLLGARPGPQRRRAAARARSRTRRPVAPRRAVRRRRRRRRQRRRGAGARRRPGRCGHLDRHQRHGLRRHRRTEPRRRAEPSPGSRTPPASSCR